MKRKRMRMRELAFYAFLVLTLIFMVLGILHPPIGDNAQWLIFRK
ncbi:MAG TPA: hypothetical protein VKP61_00760 [Candidatus Acidoferrum sp.]|nr:hypothetical protein [Candidatus Acidoferrum sp.]